jgi:hypothetical protein
VLFAEFFADGRGYYGGGGLGVVIVILLISILLGRI